MLKAVLKKEEYDALDETMQGLYKEHEGLYVLDLDADSVEHLPSVNNMRLGLNRLKTENDKLKKDLQATIDKYKDIDPEKAREAAQKLQELEDKQLLDQGKVDELIEQKTERMRADHSTQLEGFKTQIQEKDSALSAANKRLADLQIESAINSVLTSQVGKELGVLTTAIPDIIRRAHDVYRLDEDGKIVPYREDGQTIWYGKDPSKPIEVGEWLGTLKPNCPHYFGESSGGGSENKGGGPKNKGFKKRSEMSDEERAQYIHEHGNAEYFKLPA